MKLRLPDVTLVMIDGTCPELARLSLLDSMEQADFGDVLICSPNPIMTPRSCRWLRTDKWTDRLGPSAFIWYDLHKLVKTKFVLLTSWDAWVTDASVWSDEFLQYDYVGAPWWYDDGMNVGHGLLRSTRLLKFLADHRDALPIAHPEDDLLSRKYRPALEKHGFKWAPEHVAARFMFECTKPSRDSRHFMFHDSFNFPLVLQGERLAERIHLMQENEYLKTTNKLADIENGRRPEILPRLAGPPGAAEGAYDAAEMMLRAGKRDEASALLWQIVKTNPRHADAWALRGLIEDHSGRPENAMLHHGFALQAQPGRHDLWCNRGITAMNAKMFKESEESFQKSIALQPTFEGHYNYGNLLSSLMRVDDAVEQYKQAAKAHDGNHAQLNANLGVALIGQGKWREGFNAYRHRFNAPGFPPHPRFQYPKWRGQSLNGKTIMLYVEQGFGDEIMSLRFALKLLEEATVILAVRPPMFRVARQMFGKKSTILMYDEPPVEPDFMCALLDIPAFLDVTPETVPFKAGYLCAEDRGYRLQFPPGLNVGVCWASGKRDLQPSVAETARQKSLTFEQLVAPLARPGVNLVCLQQNHSDHAALSKLGVHDPMAGVTDFADTAWIIDHLDLVITVDTSVAHLAGALGKPVWNLTRFDALWPWMQETSKTCWYDSMTLYRQERPLDWTGPLKRLQADFAAKVDGALLHAAE